MTQRPLIALFTLGAGLFAAGAGAATVTVNLVNVPDNMFTPQVVRIRAGDTVLWNAVAGTHNVFADDGSFTSGSPATAPWQYSRVFSTPGTFGYYCQPHGSPGSGMFGTVVVLDTVELAHGSDQSEDEAGGADRYRIGQKAYSSYEVVVDSLTGNPSLSLDRTDASGTNVMQPGAPVTTSINVSQSLRWENPTANSVDDQRIRVTNSSCGTGCVAEDTYRIRTYDTTVAFPRFNQSGTQVTVLILQNPSNYTVTGHVYFWNAAGVLLNTGGLQFTLNAKASQTINGSSVPGVAGGSGTITVSHNARYGDLTGKAVALEPSTGFSFDTPAVVRAR